MGWGAGQAADHSEGSEKGLHFPTIPEKFELPELTEKVIKDLSTDQHHGYRLVKALRKGKMV